MTGVVSDVDEGVLFDIKSRTLQTYVDYIVKWHQFVHICAHEVIL